MLHCWYIAVRSEDIPNVANVFFFLWVVGIIIITGRNKHSGEEPPISRARQLSFEVLTITKWTIRTGEWTCKSMDNCWGVFRHIYLDSSSLSWLLQIVQNAPKLLLMGNVVIIVITHQREMARTRRVPSEGQYSCLIVLISLTPWGLLPGMSSVGERKNPFSWVRVTGSCWYRAQWSNPSYHSCLEYLDVVAARL